MSDNEQVSQIPPSHPRGTELRRLHAILERRPDGTPQPIAEPLIPLLDTTLLTNAPGEPGLLNQLDTEIDSADAIDVVMAFIRRSGINPLLASLRRHWNAADRCVCSPPSTPAPPNGLRSTN